MKAIIYTRYGSSDVLQIAEVPKPILKKDNDVLIRICAVEVTKADCEMRSFSYAVKWFWLPLTVLIRKTCCVAWSPTGLAKKSWLCVRR